MRRARALSALAIGIAVALVATACSGSSGGDQGSGPLPLNTNPGKGGPQRGGTLNMLGTADVDYMDPNITYYSLGYLNLRMWSRQLFAYPAVPGKVTTPAPDLATAIPTKANGGISTDGKTYKITIRKGVKWDTNPPRQVTAADLVRGLKRTCNPAQPFGGMPDFETLIVGLSQYCAGYAKVDAKSASAMAKYQNTHDIAGATVDPNNPLTVVYKLTHPAAYFVPMLTMPAFSPAPKEYDQYVPAGPELAQHTISDGPYKIASYTPKKSITYVRNEVWDPATDPIRKAYVDKIEVNEVGNPNAIQQQLEAGTPDADLEWDAFPPNSTIPKLIASKDPNLNLRPSFSSNPYIVFNTVSPNNGGAMQKVKVRQALSQALDRGHLIQDASGPRVSPPLTHVLPAGISGVRSNTKPDYYPHDPDAAKKVLEANNVKTLKLLYRSASTVSKSMFVTIQQDLGDVGIKVKGVPVSNDDFITKYVTVPSVAKRGVWDLTLASWGPDWYGDAARSFFAPLFYGNDGKAGSAFPPNGTDIGFYNSDKVNRLIERASATADPAAAAKLWAQADAAVMKDAAIFPISTNNQATYHASHVHNTVPIPMLQQIDPTNVWLSKG